MGRMWETLFGRHAIDVWRDDWTLAAGAALNQLAADLGPVVETLAAQASRRDVFLSPGRFLSEQVAPAIAKAADPGVEALMAQANAALLELVEHQAVWTRSPEAAVPTVAGLEVWSDLAMAAGPLVGGAAVAVAIPAAATTTTTILFGFATVVTVSWPVVAIGGALAGTAIATGAINAARMHDKFVARLRRKGREHVARVLITGTAKEPSRLQHLTRLFAQAAIDAKGG